LRTNGVVFQEMPFPRISQWKQCKSMEKNKVVLCIYSDDLVTRESCNLSIINESNPI
jgi:hypothetical protein